MGELTQLGIKPHSPYYGTADATMLWLILLSEYWRWTGDDDLVLSLLPNIRAALDWIDKYGDRDGDGYVEYQTRSAQGLGNQCWRDSWNGVQFADGTIPVLPIATCELQGYVYDAKTPYRRAGRRAAQATRHSPSACGPRPKSCASASIATSGSTSAVATTRSASTATRSRSIR